MTYNMPGSLYQFTKLELVYRNKVKTCDRLKIQSSKSAYEIFMLNWDFEKIDLMEQFKIMMLDVACKCIGISDVATGGVTGCIADPRIIYSTALLANASRLILAHNHPSGNLTPSKEDIAITQKLFNAGTFLDVRVDDHLIITPHGYHSFADSGMMP